MNSSIKHNLSAFFKQILFAVLTGLIIGSVASFFLYCLNTVVAYRDSHFLIIGLAPVAGLLIVAFYKALDAENDKGTNTVLSSVNSENGVPLKMAPLIFLSTVITHLYGGSAGREGAALQIGGSIGNSIGRVLKLSQNGKKMFIMSGMAAAFSAMFGTPATATVFSIEVVSVGNMQYGALFPCTVSSLVASAVARHFGFFGEKYNVSDVLPFNGINAGKTIVLGCACAMVSIIFCIILHNTGKLFKKIENRYLRIVVGGCLIVVMVTLFGTDYAGAGTQVIERAVEGNVFPFAFVIKMILTAVTLGCGFKGGEIVPTLFTGATLGCIVGQILGISPSLFASVGMVSVFCGVTNCPLASFIMAFELFGTSGMPFYLLSISLSYMLSGYYSLYSTQIFTYSKTEAKYVEKRAK
ncbi:MAG: chloride channel protein [Firmicutes bacterium]|nr:chloride channel protein [Bacillota bacterium]